MSDHFRKGTNMTFGNLRSTPIIGSWKLVEEYGRVPNQSFAPLSILALDWGHSFNWDRS